MPDSRVTIEPDDAPTDQPGAGKELQHGLISALWISAWFAEATYYVAALVFEGLLLGVLFIFGQIALVAAIIGTMIYVWTMPRWDSGVMGWMWVGCLLAGFWLGMYYAPLAPIVWALAALTTLRWVPAWWRSGEGSPHS